MESELFNRLEDAVKDAMKAHDSIKRDCLRSILSEVKNQTVNVGKELTDVACLKVLQKSMKTHNDSIEQFTSAGREDLVAREKAEVDVISSFLPKMLDENEVEALVKNMLASLEKQLGRALSKKDMGLVMKAVSTSKEASCIDMKTASKLVASLLQ